MLESSRAKTTSDILKEVREKPADTVIADYFRQHRYIGSKDKKAILNRFYRILRNWFKLRWYMEQKNITPSTYQLVFFDAALHDEDYSIVFDGNKYGFPKLDGEKIDLYKSIKTDEDNMPLQVKLECSDEYWELFKDIPNFEEELSAMQGEAPFDLRINPLKVSDRKEILGDLLHAYPTPQSPYGIRMKKRININEVEAFKNGEIEVQDEGSQLIAIAVDAKPGESIVDFCAGAGGKSLLMAGMMQNKGRIIACDIFPGKLKRARQRFKRADVQNTSTKLLDESAKAWLKRNSGKFDKVLVDAPCSGSGTWRRNPDMKIKSIDIQAITNTQADILQRASKLVKSGGHLFYATCSLFKQENEEQIEKFIQNNQDFTIDGEFLSTSPYRTDTDGFFVAKLLKK